MRTSERAGAPPTAAGRSPASLAEHLPRLLLVCLTGGIVLGFYVFLSMLHRYPMPIGWDTPRYLDQVNFVAQGGLSAVPHALPPPIKTLASRGATPVLLLTLSGLLASNPFALAAVAPPAAAAAIALAAGALVSWSLRRRAFELVVVAAIVGLSPEVVRLMAPETYADNLFASAIFLAAMVPILATVRDGEAAAGAIVLLAAGGVAHESFYGLVLAILGVVAVAYLPTSWRTWRAGEARPLSTPAGRLVAVVAASAAAVGAVLLVVLRAAPDTPKLSMGDLRQKLRQDLPIYLYPVTAPLAAAGAWWLARRGRAGAGPAGAAADGQGTGRIGIAAPRAAGGTDASRTRFASRFLLFLAGAWLLGTVSGVGLFLLGRKLPAHRFLAFFLPLPILVAVAVVAFAVWTGRRWARAATAAVVVAALGGALALGTWVLYVDIAGTRGVEWIDPAKIQDAATAAAYLKAAHVPDSQPVVFVIDDSGPNPLSYVPEMAYMLRAVIPPGRVPHAYFYVGSPTRYLAGLPTYRPVPASYDANENRFWPAVRRLLPEHPVALLLSSYNPAYGAFAATHRGMVVAPNIVALSGPRPATRIAAPPIPTVPTSRFAFALLAIGALVALTVVGAGWAAILLPSGIRSFELLALSPAVGIAFLLIGGIAFDAVGVRLGGAGGATIVVATAAAGYVAAVLRLRRAGGPARFAVT